jgi:hypothetical protein
MAKVSAEELEQIVRDSHKRVMLKKKERELREYLKHYPPRKKQMLPEYQELKKIVNQRHNASNIKDSLCSNCDHRCHQFSEYGWCHNDACACRHCDCPRCDLEYNNPI